MASEDTNKIYEEYAEILAIKIFKHLDKTSTMTLNDIRKKILIKQNTKNIDINNWYEATCMKDLLKFKNKELKMILCKNSKPKTGNKSTLAKRVWDITHPEIPIYKTKNNQGVFQQPIKDYYVDDSSDSDSSDDEINMDNITDIIACSTKIYIKQEEFIYISKKGWVFQESAQYYKFIGILQDNVINSCSIPDELKQYYLQE